MGARRPRALVDSVVRGRWRVGWTETANHLVFKGSTPLSQLVPVRSRTAEGEGLAELMQAPSADLGKLPSNNEQQSHGQ